MFRKKDIPASGEAGYRSIIENPGGGNPQQSLGNIVETRKGTKTNRASLGKGNAFPRADVHSPP
ncbi:acetyltransferase [Rhizobium leguminosarum bv. viciae]|nr:acetyltransferase [Rhizobium leguminosarum bv. viciae]